MTPPFLLFGSCQCPPPTLQPPPSVFSTCHFAKRGDVPVKGQRQESAGVRGRHRKETWQPVLAISPGKATIWTLVCLSKTPWQEEEMAGLAAASTLFIQTKRFLAASGRLRRDLAAELAAPAVQLSEQKTTWVGNTLGDVVLFRKKKLSDPQQPWRCFGH